MIKPSEQAMKDYLIGLKRHTFHYAYWAEIFGLVKEDRQFPHDCVGTGNRLELPIASGMALSYEENGNIPQALKGKAQIQTKEAIRSHNKTQFHHIKGLVHPAVMALDTICAMREKRPYNKRKEFSDEEIIEIVQAECEYEENFQKLIETRKLIAEMRRIEKPRIELIIRFGAVPNIGVLPSTYHEVTRLFSEALPQFQEAGYFRG